MKSYPRTSFAPGRVWTAIACGFLAALLAAHHPMVDAQQDDATNSPPLVVFGEPEARADQAPLSAEANATLETIQSDPAASGIRIGHSNPDPVLAARALSLALPSAPDACTDSEQGEVEFTDVEVTYNEEDLVSVYARDDSTDSEISLVIQGPDVLGSVRCGADVYKIHPLGDGTTAVYEFDASQLREHPDGWGEFIQDSWTEIMQEGEQGEDGQVPDTTPRDSPRTPGCCRGHQRRNRRPCRLYAGCESGGGKHRRLHPDRHQQCQPNIFKYGHQFAFAGRRQVRGEPILRTLT